MSLMPAIIPVGEYTVSVCHHSDADYRLAPMANRRSDDSPHGKLSGLHELKPVYTTLEYALDWANAFSDDDTGGVVQTKDGEIIYFVYCGDVKIDNVAEHLEYSIFTADWE